MIKKYTDFIKEGLDSPGSVDVPGQDYETRVNSRNYTPANQPLPIAVDSMFEANYFTSFLEEEGKSENFNNFIKEKKRSGSEITRFLRESFDTRIQGKNK
jgi:hypothetical protein